MKAPYLVIVALLLNAGCDRQQGNAKWTAADYTYYAHENNIYITNEDRGIVYFLDNLGREVESGKRIFNGASWYPVINKPIPKETNPFDWKPDRTKAIDDAKAYLSRRGTLFYIKQADNLSAETLEHEIGRIVAYYYSSYNERLAGLEKPVAYDTGGNSH